MNTSQLRPESLVVASGRPPRDPDAPLNAPIVLAAPFHSAEENRYSRHDATDTVRAFEAAVGALDGGMAVAFASGVAGVAAIAEGQAAGCVAVVPSSGYSGSIAIFDEQERLGRMQLRRVDVADTRAVVAAVRGSDLVWLETVTNPLLGVVDLPTVIGEAHAAGATVCVDSTFSTPLVARPLSFGADLVLHSATKYLGGHSDLVMGVLVAGSADRGEALRDRRGLTGAMPGALESYLALRGVRTLAVRMERAQANAGELARRLSAHHCVTRVRYPGLPEDPGHELAARLYDGFGAMISFEVAGTAEHAESVCQRVALITHATSLGGVESLIERRARHSIDAMHGTPPTLLRLSVGIEHVEDLWADLTQALG